MWYILLLSLIIGLCVARINLHIKMAIIFSYLTFIKIIASTSLIIFLPIALSLGAFYLLATQSYIRRKYFTAKLLNKIASSMPKISDTEQIALNAGTVGWDGELFTGKPNWEKLLTSPKPQLSTEEQDFINGPVKELCNMINDWQINYIDKDLPKSMWTFLAKNKFFGLLIPKEYGGLGFSDLAHSEILTIIAGLSTTVASTVSVPNSLGPAELLRNYGTKEQKDYYLPKLAIGEEIPCFALTGPYAGSDATSLPDTGIICKKTIAGKEVIGINLNFEKRYITLAPIATVVGLAFQLIDPEKILSTKLDLGITCALIPSKTPGMNKGKRHMPLNSMFQNGPIYGKDVFIPLDFVIGGQSMIGQGWKMLVECLSTGRVISLPSAATGKIKTAAMTSGAYARIRNQFNTYIGRFEGIQEKLSLLAANVYICDAARSITAHMIDLGEKPSVPGAILKYHVTEKARESAIHAMDIHAGKAVIMGPKNYTAESYINSPIGVTVEGANILTRNLIIFGQGSIRCHPFIMQELEILQYSDKEKQIIDFDKVLTDHITFTIKNICNSIIHTITLGKLIKVENKYATIKTQLQQVTWASCAFAVLSDFSLLILGGKLKFKERLSARLGDLLSNLYLSSMCIKRFIDDGANKEHFELMLFSQQLLINDFWVKANEIINNFPNLVAKYLLKFCVMPFGILVTKPSDKLAQKVAAILLEPNDVRSHILHNVFYNKDASNPMCELENTLIQVVKTIDIENKIKTAVHAQKIKSRDVITQIKEAVDNNIITEQEAISAKLTADMRFNVISVDSFDKI